MYLKDAIQRARRELILTGAKLDKNDNVYFLDGLHYYATFALKLLKLANKEKMDRRDLDLVIDWLKGFNDFDLLSEITDDPNEWQCITDCKGNIKEYQNLRNTHCFSKDLKTYRNNATGEFKKSWDYKWLHRDIDTYKLFKDNTNPHKLASEVLDENSSI